jgi:aspartyl-tRNA(Asn)/glutamyl-tRNA(Gln) amidotransferase subunit A
MFELSAHAIADLLQKGEITAVEVAEKTLKRIAQHDPKIGSFLSIFSERTMDRAAAIDAKRKVGKRLGKLAGVLVGLKDNILVKGEVATCGSRMLENYVAPYDATATRLLEEEDAIIIGKTNLDEFAMGSSTEHSAYHLTKNPWDLACTPGGSSGGSGAAVAARLIPAAFGSDTGGSVRQPAAFCGIVGFKPTYGRVSRYGLVAYGSSLDQISPFATNVTDIALLMEVVARHCANDATSLPFPPEHYTKSLHQPHGKLKVGVPMGFLEGLGKEAHANFLASLDKLRSLGAEIVEVDLSLLKYSLAVYYVLATAEASTNLARFDGIRYGRRSPRAATLEEVYDFSRQEGLGAEVKQRILLGTYVLSAGFQDAYYKQAQKVRALIIDAFKTAFSKCQLIAMPTTPFSAFPLGSIQDPLQLYLQDIYTIASNLTGTPAISIPAGFTHDNKPLSLQLIGPQMHDAAVLRLAYAFEQATDYHRKLPPLFKD